MSLLNGMAPVNRPPSRNADATGKPRPPPPPDFPGGATAEETDATGHPRATGAVVRGDAAADGGRGLA